jgi:galactokinase
MRATRSAVRTFFAPGRVNLIGEHTDYAGGLVLPIAVDRGVTVAVTPADSIELRSDGFGVVELDAGGAGDASGWGRYVAAVAAELDLLGRPSTGMRGHVTSTLPAGAGLSSSAALEIALAIALCAIAGFPVEPVELVQAARRAEERAVGVPCGVMDQAAAIFARAGHAVLIDASSLDHRLLRLPEELEIVVLDSGVRRRLEDSGYADRRAELESGDPRRLRHVSTENERVRRVAAALEQTPADLATLGRAFRESHESLRDDFEVSTPELDLLVERAYAHGAIAARMTGGGFGGSVVALVERGQVDALIEAVDAPAAMVVTAGDAAHELTAT